MRTSSHPRHLLASLLALAVAAGGVASAGPARAHAKQLWSYSQKDLKDAAKTPPKDPQKALELGIALRRAGLFNESYQVLRKAYLRPSPSSDALRLEAARSLQSQGAYKRALKECAGLKATEVTFRVCRAEAQLMWKRASLALEEAEKAVAADAGSYDAKVALGRAQKLSGKPDEAETTLNGAISANASRYEAHYELGQLYVKENKPRAKAVAAFRAAMKADGDVPEVLVELGEVLEPGSEAEALFAAALKIRPEYGDALAGRGVSLLALNKLDDAQKSLTEALKLDAKRSDWRVALGRVELAKGEHQAALKSAQAAQKLVKNDAGAKLLEADALAALGDIDVAIEAYELAYGYAHEDPSPLVHAAKACLEHDRPTTGRAFAERATQEYPKWGPAWVIAGDIAVAQKDKGPARAAYKRALSAQGPVDKAEVKRKLAALK
ncbi:MAG: tetratricopeptide repeat protein [Polyangiaceae bacterium]